MEHVVVRAYAVSFAVINAALELASVCSFNRHICNRVRSMHILQML